MKEKIRTISKKAIPAICWILIWQVVSMLVSNDILFAGPVRTLKTLAGLLFTAEFRVSVLRSLVRILAGFVLGVIAGALLGFLAGLNRPVRAFLNPFIHILRSVPVASFVILLLIWFGSNNISVIICMIVTLPSLYYNTVEGMDSSDKKLNEMCLVFRVSLKDRIKYVYFPQLKPFLKSALRLSIGMSFKSGIAAEVIGQPLHTMGNGLYLAKIYLETGELFAWTIVIVVLAAVCERLLMFFLNKTR
ncbi:MAG: ABC transporter permease subunit [Lachnospiraceae bacterium]|nr:ABC transporter permease subunit [Lachnospiraceae bacterium]